MFFKEHLKVPVAPSTLYEFVKSRARQTKKTMVELPDVTASRPLEFQAQPPTETAPIPASQPVRPGITETLRAVLEQPILPPKPPNEFRFDAREQAGWTPKPGQK